MDTAFAAREREAQIEFRIVRPDDGELRWIEARRLIFYDAADSQCAWSASAPMSPSASAPLLQLRAFTETLEEAVKERTRELEAENEARRGPRRYCARRRRWRRSASSPAASRTTSTTFSPS